MMSYIKYNSLLEMNVAKSDDIDDYESCCHGVIFC